MRAATVLVLSDAVTGDGESLFNVNVGIYLPNCLSHSAN